MTHAKFISFPGRVLMLGFGSIGHAILPLLLRHIDMPASAITIVSADEDKEKISGQYGVNFLVHPLTRENYQAFLREHLRDQDFLLNLSVDVSSLSLIEYCWRNRAFYLDTCIEPWPGRYVDPATPPSKRSNYKLREDLLNFRLDKQGGTTAIVTQGANPGMASILVKQALMNMARDVGLEIQKPACREDWARLAQQLTIKVIHIAERDTQTTRERKQRDEFVNTWSVEGFVSEGMQPAELGWGIHEQHWPEDAQRHGYGCDAAIYLQRPGAATRVRSWTPLEGSYHGFLITHGESISITDHLSLFEEGDLVYRPTVHYAYHPCDDAVLSLHELAGKNWQLQKHQRILNAEITEGMDELGVLLMGNPKGVYWYGSRLSIQQARELAPQNTATSLQVVAGILAGFVWAVQHPQRGILEPDDLDHEAILKIASPYLGELIGVYSDWTPLAERSDLFPDQVDQSDPWQFKNFRVV